MMPVDPQSHAAPALTSLGGLVLAIAPADRVDFAFRFVGLLVVVIGATISVIRLLWDAQDRHERQVDRRWSRDRVDRRRRPTDPTRPRQSRASDTAIWPAPAGPAGPPAPIDPRD